MAYTDLAELAADADLRQRLYACAATLGMANGQLWVDRWIWLIVAQDPSWVDAWQLAHVAPYVLYTDADGKDVYSPDTRPERPGWDSRVVTDEMIWERLRAVSDDKGASV